MGGNTGLVVGDRAYYAGRAEEMLSFDLLPPHIRAVLNYAPCNFSAAEIIDALVMRELPEYRVLENLHRSSNQYVRFYQAALENGFRNATTPRQG